MFSFSFLRGFSRIKNCGKWSDIPTSILPLEALYLVGVKKILSISVLEVSVIRVGKDIIGRRKKECKESTKAFTGLDES